MGVASVTVFIVVCLRDSLSSCHPMSERFVFLSAFDDLDLNGGDISMLMMVLMWFVMVLSLMILFFW